MLLHIFILLIKAYSVPNGHSDRHYEKPVNSSRYNK